MARIAHDIFLGLVSRWSSLVLVLVSIAVGAACSAALVGVLIGLQKKEATLIDALGADVFAVTNSGVSGIENRQLSLHVAEGLKRQLPGTLISSVQKIVLPTAGSAFPLNIVRTDSELLAVRGWSMHGGRFFDLHDIQGRSRVAVVTTALASRWNWHTGTIIQLDDQPYRVIGELSPHNIIDQPASLSNLAVGERSVFIPVSIPIRSGQGASEVSAPVDAILVRAGRNPNLRQLYRKIDSYLTGYQIASDSLTWVTPDSLTAGIGQLRKVIAVTFGSVAALLLLVAAVTLASTLITSVKQRFQEIGLRRALGATRSSIRWMFVVEGIVITASGALAGILIAIVIGSVVNVWLPVPIEIDIWMLVIPLVIYLVVGVVSSLWPAQFAAQLTPTDCLRN